MPRYIEEKEARNAINFLICDCIKDHKIPVWDDVYEAFQSVPTADVVEVVRCKDCIHCDCIMDGMGFFYCDFDEGRTVSPNGFCNVAERRKGTGDETSD